MSIFISNNHIIFGIFNARNGKQKQKLLPKFYKFKQNTFTNT